MQLLKYHFVISKKKLFVHHYQKSIFYFRDYILVQASSLMQIQAKANFTSWPFTQKSGVSKVWSSLKPRPRRVQKVPFPLNPSLTFFGLCRLAHSFSPGPGSVEVGLTGRVSKQAKRSPGRLIGPNRQMRHALTGGDVGWVVGSMLCQPWLSWSGQLVNPWHGHSPTWGPVLAAAGSATSGHPIVSWHH